MPSHDGVGAKTPPRPDHLPNRRNPEEGVLWERGPVDAPR